MDTVKILDRNFKMYLREAEIQQRIREVANQISNDLQGKDPLFVGILNGSFMFAAFQLKFHLSKLQAMKAPLPQEK